jgi:DNA-binding NtrC family response regulator
MSKKSRKILIADEEEGIRESLKLILKDHCDLILTDNGDQALRCIEKSADIGLVFLGIKMPGMNGREVIRQIQEKRPDLKVVIVTDYRSDEAARKATRLGASGYIMKPFKSDDILNTVKNIL